jgi:serine/threonine protein kinase
MVENINDETLYAVKRIPIKPDSEIAKLVESSAKETVRLARVRGHVNIVQYYSSWFEDGTTLSTEQMSTDEEMSDDGDNPSGHEMEVTQVQAAVAGSNETPQQSDMQTSGSEPLSGRFLCIQLELCTTTLFRWIGERNKVLNDPHYEPDKHTFGVKHVCQALRSWVKSTAYSVEFNNHAPTSSMGQHNNYGGLWELISETNTNSCLEGIVRGLNYLHSKQLAHQDLHEANILILVTEAGEVIPKLSDFGSAKTLERISKCLKHSELENDRRIDSQGTEGSIGVDPYSYNEESKGDMLKLARIVFDLYYPRASQLRQQLKEKGKSSQMTKWKFEEISDWEPFKKCFEYQAKWIEQLACDEMDKRPTSVDILRQGEKIIFDSRRVRNEILEAENSHLRLENEQLKKKLEEISAR